MQMRQMRDMRRVQPVRPTLTYECLDQANRRLGYRVITGVVISR